MVQCKTLPNGVRIVTEEMAHVHSTSIGIWINAGSRNETAKENGIAHFIEHMLFKGTDTMNAQDIAVRFDRFGGHVNAFTSKEYTCFYTKVLERHAEEAVRLLTDMFFRSAFLEEEIERERQVIIEEIRMVEDTADDVVHDLLDVAAFGDHSIGRPILGTEASINSFTREDLLNFMEREYRPENIVISIAGRINEQLLAVIEEAFTHHKRGERKTCDSAPTLIQPKHLIRKKAVEQAHLCLGFQGVPLVEDNIYASVLYNHLLGGGMSSRLFQEIREQKALAYSVYSYHTSYQDTGLLTVYAGTATHRLDESYHAIIDTVKKIRCDRITATDVEDAKAHVLGSTVLSLESPSSRMNRNGRNELAIGSHQTLDELSDRIESVTHDQVKLFAESVYNSPIALSLISQEGKAPS
ncbi:LOW QUALITY PROTEIN: peptidase [Geomicrobium sp. JCM 19055]|nr:LOW QUALITY PROTEIN: peptidase [Geomicrobium sp. JCM 19055]